MRRVISFTDNKKGITPKYFCASAAGNGVGSGLFPLLKSQFAGMLSPVGTSYIRR